MPENGRTHKYNTACSAHPFPAIFYAQVTLQQIHSADCTSMCMIFHLLWNFFSQSPILISQMLWLESFIAVMFFIFRKLALSFLSADGISSLWIYFSPCLWLMMVDSWQPPGKCKLTTSQQLKLWWRSSNAKNSYQTVLGLYYKDLPNSLQSP